MSDRLFSLPVEAYSANCFWHNFR